MNNLLLEKQVTDFRQKNGVGANDPIRLKSFLSQLNVITVFKPLSKDFSGMALKLSDGDNTIRYMLVNSTHNLGKQHFTICHELYHLFIQKNFNSMVCNTGLFDKKNIEEYNADIFASLLLLPETGIKALIPDNEMGKDKISLQTILKIEHFYSCSRTALLYRLKNLSLLSSEGYEKYNQNIKKNAVLYGYSVDLYNSGNENKNLVLGDYGEVARKLFDNEIISETHYMNLLMDLGMNIDQLNNITSIDAHEKNIS
jgi:Zn-dependent peptidase ImmA (M78 family)